MTYGPAKGKRIAGPTKTEAKHQRGLLHGIQSHSRTEAFVIPNKTQMKRHRLNNRRDRTDFQYGLKLNTTHLRALENKPPLGM